MITTMTLTGDHGYMLPWLSLSKVWRTWPRLLECEHCEDLEQNLNILTSGYVEIQNPYQAESKPF